VHPTTGEMMRFDELPQDLQDCEMARLFKIITDEEINKSI
jgi:hypothetical protein